MEACSIYLPQSGMDLGLVLLVTFFTWKGFTMLRSQFFAK